MINMKKMLIVAQLIVVSSFAYGQQISKDMWFGQMRTSLPIYFCSEEQIFRRCYKVSESQCKVVAADATNACLKQYDNKIPSILNNQSGGYWGAQVGACAGNAYGVALIKQKIKTAKCNY